MLVMLGTFYYSRILPESFQMYNFSPLFNALKIKQVSVRRSSSCMPKNKKSLFARSLKAFYFLSIKKVKENEKMYKWPIEKYN
jgi:hypothetical protein